MPSACLLRCALTTLLLLLLALASPPAALAVPAGAYHLNTDRVPEFLLKGKLSPVMRCQEPLRKLCLADVPARVSVRDVWRCFFDKREQIDKADCREWADGVQACWDDARAAGEDCETELLTPATLRTCVAGVDEAKLSERCRASEFYRHASPRAFRLEAD